uniref:Fc fragment of IgE receptor Ig n=1 Tax=Phasianus colchicus TaxID=9054 RepID=A0A669QYA9_PHACC
MGTLGEGREDLGRGIWGWGWVGAPLAPRSSLPLLPTEALAEPELCYILDGILFLYGIILTILYCRLKVSAGTPSPIGDRAQRPLPTPSLPFWESSLYFPSPPLFLFMVLGGNLRLIVSFPCSS